MSSQDATATVTSAQEPAVSSTNVREIYKNGWLKKIPVIEKRPGPFSKAPKPEKIWVVFCVHDEKEPFLEYYENRRSAYSHTPLSRFDLNHCLHISPTILIQEDDHEFAVTLGTQVIRLAAPTQELMVEWIDTLNNKLRELGILQPKDNVYSREPTLARNNTLPPSPSGHNDNFRSSVSSDISVAAGRDPNSPLPPIPPLNLLSVRSGQESPSYSSSTVTYVRSPPPQPLHNNSNNNSPLPQTPTYIHSAPPDSQNRNNQSSNGGNVFTFDFVTSALYDTTRTPQYHNLPNNTEVAANQTSSVNSSPGCLYEPIFRTPAATVDSARVVNNNPPVRLPPPTIRRRSESEIANPVPTSGVTMTNVAQRALSSNLTHRPHSLNGIQDIRSNSFRLPMRHATFSQTSRMLQRQHSHSPHPMEEVPASYETLPENYNDEGVTQAASNTATLSLKQAQVQSLLKEISHRGGVRLLLRKKDSLGAIALVDAFNSVWVAGWKQKDHPLLHNTFHIGDQILSIAGRQISTVQEANKAIKQQSLVVEFIVQRLPFGRPFAIRREFEGQDLGIVREGNTAEIKEVISTGLAARHGLTVMSPTVDGTGLCNWMLTEVNNRPLNLFFRDNEVQERLNAVGRDISILVQPAQLVRSLKKQLKGLRNYKDYVVQ